MSNFSFLGAETLKYGQAFHDKVNQWIDERLGDRSSVASYTAVRKYARENKSELQDYLEGWKYFKPSQPDNKYSTMAYPYFLDIIGMRLREADARGDFVDMAGLPDDTDPGGGMLVPILIGAGVLTAGYFAFK